MQFVESHQEMGARCLLPLVWARLFPVPRQQTPRPCQWCPPQVAWLENTSFLQDLGTLQVRYVNVVPSNICRAMYLLKWVLVYLLNRIFLIMSQNVWNNCWLYHLTLQDILSPGVGGVGEWVGSRPKSNGYATPEKKLLTLMYQLFPKIWL